MSYKDRPSSPRNGLLMGGLIARLVSVTHNKPDATLSRFILGNHSEENIPSTLWHFAFDPAMGLFIEMSEFGLIGLRPFPLRAIHLSPSTVRKGYVMFIPGKIFLFIWVNVIVSWNNR
ncbi:MAG: hypothetical protein C0392_06165 [Syntrophus sp. (in: bacteria)]|nr:hypothetical protein [Syntrophus sp. (in: bacteria)]